MEIFKMLFPFLSVFSFAEDDLNAGGGNDDSTVVEDTPADDNAEPEIIEINGKKILKSDLDALEVGADGISRAKNKAAEADRKLKEANEKLALAEGLSKKTDTPNPRPDLQSVANIAKETYKKKYPDMDESIINVATEIATEMSAGFVGAMQNSRAAVDAEFCVDKAKSAVKDATDKDVLSRWSDEVDEALNAMPMEWKTTPTNAKQAVRNAIDVVKGRHVNDILEDAKKRSNLKPRDTGAGGDSSKDVKPKSSGAGLSEAQKKDAAQHGLNEKDYKEILTKRQAADKQAGKPPRQILG